jgi:hypothetical protein
MTPTVGTLEARKVTQPTPVVSDTFDDLPLDDIDMDQHKKTVQPPMVDTQPVNTETRGGLAAAIARNRAVKQELEKTRQQQIQDQPIRKI